MRRTVVVGLIELALCAADCGLPTNCLPQVFSSNASVECDKSELFCGCASDKSRDATFPVSFGNPQSESLLQGEQQGLFSLLTVMSTRSARDLFGKRVATGYYVIEVCFFNTTGLAYTITDLELRSADGSEIHVTSPRLVAEQMYRHRKLMPQLLVSHEVLVIHGGPVQTWLFVDKKTVDYKKTAALEKGRLPPETKLVSQISVARFVKTTIPPK